MDDLTKMSQIRQKLEDNSDIRSIEEQERPGGKTLRFVYYLDSEGTRAVCRFIPSMNSTVAIIPTDNSLTDAQWTYCSKELNEIATNAYKQGAIKSLFDTRYDAEDQLFAIQFPVEAFDEPLTRFDINEQYKAILEFKSHYINILGKIFEETFGYLKSKHPSPIFCQSTMCIKNSIDSKNDLLMNAATLFYQMAGSLDSDASVFAIMSLHDLSELFKTILDENPTEGNKIRMAMKKYYSPSTWFSLSEDGQRKFYEDLRTEFLKAW